MWNYWIVVCRQTEKKTTCFCNLCFGIEWNRRFVSAFSRYFYDLSMNMRLLGFTGIYINVSDQNWWQPELDIMQHCCVALIQHEMCPQNSNRHSHYPCSFESYIWHLRINFVLSSPYSSFFWMPRFSPSFYFGAICCIHAPNALFKHKILQWVFEYLELPVFFTRSFVTINFFFRLSNKAMHNQLHQEQKEEKRKYVLIQSSSVYQIPRKIAKLCSWNSLMWAIHTMLVKLLATNHYNENQMQRHCLVVLIAKFC